MLQDNLIYVVLIAIVGLAALTVNFIITTREEQEAARQKRLSWLQGQSEHLFHAIAILREANCKPEIVTKLNEHAVSLLDEISLLAPDSELLEATTRLQRNADSARPNPAVFANDKALKRAQIYINFAGKLVVQLARGGKLTPILARSYQQELYSLRINVVVEAHINQGTRFEGTGEIMTALSHFKHAKALLVRASLPRQRKTAMMERVQQLISNIQPQRPKSRGTLADTIDRIL
ncbi:hypothetical protein ACFVYJ_00655 [Pontibacter sp. JAM-7]|uniref:hypothetical protein n=1 Tax=Pontibacter sp. JAM-7 TaxID=3366581 RepID=UPI003AF94FE6